MNQVFRFLTLFAFTLSMVSCTTTTGDPKDAAKSFFDAFSKKDYDKAAQFATKDSKTLLDLVKSMDEMGSPMDISTSEAGSDNIEKAVYEDAIIEGNKASVKVLMGNETHTIKLIKEEGNWKVALDKETLKETMAEESGSSVDEINASIDDAMKEIDKLPSDTIGAIIEEAAKELENDSLGKVLNKTGEALKKAGDALKDASKKDQ